MGKNNCIAVALDGMDEATSLSLAEDLQDSVWGFKVNSLLIESGVSIVEKLRKYGNVFADPKLHDIPNTVANGVKVLTSAGANIITIHASGSAPMIQAAVDASGDTKIICVTALTSMKSEDTQAVYNKDPKETVLHLARIANSGNADGIVCSPEELSALGEYKNLYKVVPGIRPASYQKSDDQNRVATPAAAVSAGADLLVIGRPISQADNPKEAANSILQELEN